MKSRIEEEDKFTTLKQCIHSSNEYAPHAKNLRSAFMRKVYFGKIQITLFVDDTKVFRIIKGT